MKALVEKYAGQGKISPEVKAVLTEAAETAEAELNEAKETLAGKIAELEAVTKQAAVEKVIWEAGGRNTKAILALIDMENVSYDEKKGLNGLEMDAVKEEAPYLFYEKEEKKTGTGLKKGSARKREDDIRAAFWGLR